MADQSSESAPKFTDLAARLSDMVGSSWMAQATYVAARLNIADLLADGPRTVSELAAATSTHPLSLYRLLRALASVGICNERDEELFELAPMGLLLRSTTQESLRSWILHWGGSMWPMWGHLLESVQTGESARKLLTGNGDFERLERDPIQAEIFNQAMVELTRLVAQEVVQVYDFTGMRRILDVGGGYGQLLVAVLTSTPGATGVIFDMAHASEGAKRNINSMGLGNRCQFITGSFFESIPGPADACLLKSILHDWDDARSQVILRNCRQALITGGKLLLIERIMPERLEMLSAHQALARIDLTMLIGPGGRERTESEFRSLLSMAGFQVSRIIPAGQSMNIIEAIPIQ